MRHLCLLFALFFAGCSTHPITNTLDFFKPGKMYANEVEPYGGVCIPQGPVVAPAPLGPLPGVPNVIPPPVPLPGSPAGAPPPSFPVPKVGP
jgi:hypothetical protein